MKVTLTFELDEVVTPHLFARKVADACARNGAIRPGEIVRAQNGVAFKAIEPIQHSDTGLPFTVTQWIETTV